MGCAGRRALARTLGERLRTGNKRSKRWSGTVRAGRAHHGRSAQRRPIVLALPSDEAAELVKPLDEAMAVGLHRHPGGRRSGGGVGYARSEVAHPLAGL